MPKLVMFPDEASIERFTGEHHDFVMEEVPHSVATSLTNLAARNLYVFAATVIGHGAWHLYDRYRGEVKVNREIGALSTPTPTSTITNRSMPRRPSKRSGSGRAPNAKGKSAHGFRKRKGVSARGKCPKGHYWSYKKKKCMKSKF